MSLELVIDLLVDAAFGRQGVRVSTVSLSPKERLAVAFLAARCGVKLESVH